jgi:hypothetical protein
MTDPHAHGKHHGAHDDDWMPKVRTPDNDPSLRIPDELKGSTGSSPGSSSRGEKGGGGGGGSGLMEMGKAWGVALDFVFTIAAGALAGWGFDHWRGTAPTGSIVGFAAGFAIALVRIIRYTMKQDRLEQEAKAKRGRP